MSNKDYEPQYLYKENKYYKLFQKEKEEIKKKYPPRLFEIENTAGRTTNQNKKLYLEYCKSDREIYQQYLKELADVIFTPDGNYQKFTWDIMAEVDKEDMKKKARGRMRGTGEYS